MQNFRVECELCSDKMEIQEFNMHFSSKFHFCQEIEITCPYSESHIVKYMNFEAHLKTCEKFPINCLTCKTKLLREEKESHSCLTCRIEKLQKEKKEVSELSESSSQSYFSPQTEYINN